MGRWPMNMLMQMYVGKYCSAVVFDKFANLFVVLHR